MTVVLCTVQDAWQSPSEPSDAMTFTTNRIRVRMIRAVDAWARVIEVEAWGN